MSDDQRHDEDGYGDDDPWRGPDPTSDPTSPIDHEPTGVVPQEEQPPPPPPNPYAATDPYAGHDAGASPHQPSGQQHEPDRHDQGQAGNQGQDQAGYGQAGYGQGYGAAGQYGPGYASAGDYGQGGYGTGGYGYGAAPPPPPQPYGYGSGYAPAQQNTSALILTVLSALSLLFCAGILLIPSLVLGIIGLTRNSQDPADARRKTKLGWILFAVGWGVTILAAIGIIIAVIAAGVGSGNYNYGNTY